MASVEAVFFFTFLHFNCTAAVAFLLHFKPQAKSKRLAQYIYVSDEAAAEAEIAAGWYALDGDGNPDVEGGVKDFTIPAGQGFVVNSANSNAVLQFPKAM